MILFILAFLAGDLYLQTFERLPNALMIVTVLFIAIISFVLLRKHFRASLIFIGFSCGFSWSFYWAHDLLTWTLPASMEAKPLFIRGVITSLPVIEMNKISFDFFLQKIEINHTLHSVNKKIHLSQYIHELKKQITPALTSINSPMQSQYHVGQTWQFKARLKQIHGLQNPGGGIDYEAWSIEKRLRATGIIIDSAQNKLITWNHLDYLINQWRESYRDKIKHYLPNSPTSVWLMALMMGERSAIPQTYWQVLRNTGTNHLMVVAGLHIGIMAGFAHWLTYWCWRQVPQLVLALPASIAGSAMALLVAFFYSALAGFSIPTQRACFMLSGFIFAVLYRRQINPWQALALALFIVLILNPLSVLSESFWLSFSTLALIIYSMSGRLAPKGLWWKWGRVQWIIGFGLIPLSFYFFHECSVISFIANTIAIPWLGFLILPFNLLGGLMIFISPTLGVGLLIIADKSLTLLWQVLTWFSQLHFSAWQQVLPNDWLFITTYIAFILLLLPVGFPGRSFGLIWLLPLYFFHPSKLNSGEITCTLLEVGQGLAVVIQTRSHVLVFDAGARYSADADMGERVVLPYLQAAGITKIDKLVISHGDNDHMGGADSLLKSLPVFSLVTSVPERFKLPATYCLSGMQWQWDGIHFMFLHPDKSVLGLNNDSSCVLRIVNQRHSILLTGDIERYAENYLLQQNREHLPSTILIAPHHGSKTSALKEFVEVVHPQYVLYATGYRNQYHFPHPMVVQIYQQMNSKQFNTAETGALTMRLNQKGISIEPYRLLHRRYWHHK